VKVIVPFPPGGATDTAARPIVGYLSRVLGEQFYVENKSGTGGDIGIEAVARSQPDGYTLLITSIAAVTRPYVSNLKVDPVKDLISIVELIRQPLVIAVHPSLGIRTLTELVASARREPDQRYVLGGGIGSEQHILGAWFAHLAGITLEPVPYRGGDPAVNDLLAGHVKIGSLGATAVIQHHVAGSLYILAQSTKRRCRICLTFQPSKNRVLAVWSCSSGSDYLHRLQRRSRSSPASMPKRIRRSSTKRHAMSCSNLGRNRSAAPLTLFRSS
jgi:tripartite-type tricarboxylate transporter receptor subunit TctC